MIDPYAKMQPPVLKLAKQPEPAPGPVEVVAYNQLSFHLSDSETIPQFLDRVLGTVQNVKTSWQTGSVDAGNRACVERSMQEFRDLLTDKPTVSPGNDPAAEQDANAFYWAAAARLDATLGDRLDAVWLKEVQEELRKNITSSIWDCKPTRETQWFISFDDSGM